jgi:DNA-directed RNA polymerase specialized sigma24 family protein
MWAMLVAADLLDVSPRNEAKRGISFDDAASGLIEASSDASLDPQALTILLDGLVRVLRTSRFHLSSEDAEDVAQEAVIRLVEFARTDAADRVHKPGAYLIRVAQHLAIDRARQATVSMSAPEDLETLATDDDAIAALLDADASVSLIEGAMRAAVSAGDHLAVRVVVHWLDLAQKFGEAPSSRAVAQRTGLSHTSVNKALSRFRHSLSSFDRHSVG